MSSAFKGMTAGLIATLVLSVFMILNGTLGLMPQIDIIRLLTSLGTLTAPSAWMDHFIVGVIVWGLLFACYDAVATRPARWMKGMIFGIFAWLMMMLAFMPLAGAGFFGAKLDAATLVGLLALHLVYGLVLGVTYEFLGFVAPIRISVSVAGEQTKVVALAGPNPFTMNSADINDHLPTSSPSGKTVLIIFGSLAGFFALLVLVVEFRTTLGL